MAESNLTCCCSLRTGGLILAILDIISGIITIVVSILTLGVGVAFPDIMTMALNEKYTDTTDLALTAAQKVQVQVEQDAVSSVVSTVAYVIAALLLVDGLITIIWGSILVHGIRKESVSLMKIWMIFRVITLIFEFGASVAVHSISFSALDFFGDICGHLIAIWLILIVHYLRMDIFGKYQTLGKDDLKFNPL